MSHLRSWSCSRLDQSGKKINKDIWCHQCGNKQERSLTAAQRDLKHELWAPTVRLVLRSGEKRRLWMEQLQMLQKQPSSFAGSDSSNERLNLNEGWVSPGQQSPRGRTEVLASPGLAQIRGWGVLSTRHKPLSPRQKQPPEPIHESPSRLHLLHGAVRGGGYACSIIWRGKHVSAQKTSRGRAKAGKAQWKLSAANN